MLDTILSSAVSQGAVISGSNPWDIESRLHGIVLRGWWDESTMTLTISVVDVVWYVSCETVWNMIDAMLHGFIKQAHDRDRSVNDG